MNLTIRLVLAFFGSLSLSLIATYLVRAFAVRCDFVARSRDDRWGIGERVIALGGGLGIVCAILLSLIVLNPSQYVLFAALAILTTVGFVDDLKSVRPAGKLVAQVLVAGILVAGGYQIQGIYGAFSIPLSLCCLIGISNSYNFTDNMDGHSSSLGIAISLSVAFISVSLGLNENAQLSFIIAGALAGFFYFNRAPASIFMGDTGSLPIGLLLAVICLKLTVVAKRSPFAVLSALAPLSFLVFDTGLVAYARSRAGRQFLQGGQDHSSHRLVRSGFSENRAIFVAATLAALSGLVSYFAIRYSDLEVPLICLLVAVFVVTGMFLSRVPSVYESESLPNAKKNDVVQILAELVTDVLLIAACWILAHWLRFHDEGSGVFPNYLNVVVIPLLPIVMPLKVAVMFLFGVYSNKSSQAKFDNAWKLASASCVATLTLVIASFLYNRMANLSRLVVVLDLALNLVFIIGLKGALRFLPIWVHGLARQKTNCLWIGAPEFEAAARVCAEQNSFVFVGMFALAEFNSIAPRREAQDHEISAQSNPSPDYETKSGAESEPETSALNSQDLEVSGEKREQDNETAIVSSQSMTNESAHELILTQEQLKILRDKNVHVIILQQGLRLETDVRAHRIDVKTLGFRLQ